MHYKIVNATSRYILSWEIRRLSVKWQKVESLRYFSFLGGRVNEISGDKVDEISGGRVNDMSVHTESMRYQEVESLRYQEV